MSDAGHTVVEGAAPVIHSGATIEGQYRYDLWRGDPAKPACVFVMLNPSTADADRDDNTIRRCRAFATGFGFERLVVVNLYALRATDPAELWRHPDPVGPKNDDAIVRHVRAAGLVIAAWGAHAKQARIREVGAFLESHRNRLRALALTNGGQPRHPLYLRKDLVPFPFEWQTKGPGGRAGGAAPLTP